jgi:glycosyltransferase involved in cell wall biosynthesis
MKILHVCELLEGGTASYLEEVLPRQVESYGRDNVFLAAPANHLAAISEKIDGVVQLPFRRSGRDLSSLLRLAASIHRAISTHAPDIVHLHSTFAGAVGRSLMPLFRTRPIVIYCPHGWAFDMEISRQWRTLIRLFERLMAASTDAVINVSRHEEALSRSLGIDHRKSRTIISGIADLSNGIGSVDLRPEKELTNLLFVGRLDRQKGIDLLLVRYPDWSAESVHLYVAGDTVVSAKGAPTQEFDKITFLGWQRRDRIPALLEACDLLIVPSRWEAFGIAVLEAMRSSRPVAVSNRGGLPELVEEGVTGFIFEPERITELVRFVSTLGRERLLQMGRAGRQRYLSNFQSDRMNCEIDALYRDLMLRRMEQ